MYDAEVGDDVFGEDPTVNRLQEEIATLLGKEAALLVSSGVMGNQLGLYENTRRGEDVLLERSSHIFNNETGAAGDIVGVVLNALEGHQGSTSTQQGRAAMGHGT